MTHKRYVVYGPPAAGKTTWVQQRREYGDVVWDFDAVSALMLGVPERKCPGECVSLFTALAATVVDWLATHEVQRNVYIILTAHGDAVRIAKQIGAELVEMATDEAACIERLKERQAGQGSYSGVRTWWRERRQREQTATMAGG